MEYEKAYEAIRAASRDDVAQAVHDWAMVHGIVSRDKLSKRCDTVPITVYPTPFPAVQLDKAIEVQRALNVMLHTLRLNHSFILDEHTEAAAADPNFTGRLVEIYRAVQLNGHRQKLTLSVHRTDYMLQDESTGPTIRQVEINTIACAFGGLGVEPRRLHQYVLSRFSSDGPGDSVARSLPENNTRQGLAKAFAGALTEYQKQGGNPSAIMVMVVQPGECNAFDQRMLEYELWENHRIRTERASLAQINDDAEYADDGTMSLWGFEVGLVYFRAGYSPDDYPTIAEWTAREHLEKSRAIKCPSVLDQLTGTKKMQQILARPGILEKFMVHNSAEDVAAVRSTFAGLHSLDIGVAGDSVAADAVAHPQKYVLKPQREGGGNNLYEAEMVAAIKSMKPEERAGYILMERLYPPSYPSVVMRDGTLHEGAVVSELGVYGVCLSNIQTGEIVSHEVVGHLLRSKFEEVLDGGVSTGRAVLDSPLPLK